MVHKNAKIGKWHYKNVGYKMGYFKNWTKICNPIYNPFARKNMGIYEKKMRSEPVTPYKH